MAKVVCEDCGEVIAEGVEPDEAERLADEHTHNDMPTLVDRRDISPSYDPDDGEGGTGDGGIFHPERDSHSENPELREGDGPVRERTDNRNINDEMAEMDEMDDARDPGDWWAVREGEEYDEAGDEFSRRYRRVQEQIQKERSTVGEMLAHRDEQIEEDPKRMYVPGNGHRPASDGLRKSDKWEDLRDDVADAFRQLKTRDVKVPSRKGNELNVDAIVQRASGDRSQDRLFHRKQQAAKGDRVIGVSVDFSGSMREDKAKLALAAVAEATEIIGDDFTANCWARDRRNRLGLSRGRTSIGLITGPDESFDWGHLDAFETGGGTPTADGIDQMTDVMEDMTAREKVCVVVTDGVPNVKFGGDERGASLTGDAIGDAAQVVRKARQDGFKVVGLGVGAVNDEQMAEIFGPDGFVAADMDDLAEQLVRVYRKQLRVGD